ncbi:Feather keratin Cos2-3, partial [Opisthocomus hoazin]
MSCYNPCLPCRPCGPTPLANSCNEPCVRQCQAVGRILSCDGVPITSGCCDLSGISSRYSGRR